MSGRLSTKTLDVEYIGIFRRILFPIFHSIPLKSNLDPRIGSSSCSSFSNVFLSGSSFAFILIFWQNLAFRFDNNDNLIF